MSEPVQSHPKVDPAGTLLILLGASTWPRAALQGSRSFARSAQDIRDYFTQIYGALEENVLWLFDADLDALKIHSQIYDFLKRRRLELEQTAIPVTDVIVYFIGHGDILDGHYAMLPRTFDPRNEATALRARNLASAVVPIPNVRRWIFIDACFAAEAAKSMQTNTITTIIKQAFREADFLVPCKGTVLFCSSDAKSVSHVNEDAGYTTFSGAMLNVVANPTVTTTDQLLTLSQLRDRMWSAIQADVPKGLRRNPLLLELNAPDGPVLSIPIFRVGLPPKKTRQRREWLFRVAKYCRFGRWFVAVGILFFLLPLIAMFGVQVLGNAFLLLFIPRKVLWTWYIWVGVGGLLEGVRSIVRRFA